MRNGLKTSVAKEPTVEELELLGRERLSRNFYMREFLHSEVATHPNIVNYPDDVTVALDSGRRLCEALLEPLLAIFGRISIRSGFRSAALNAACHSHGYNCVENSKAFGRHIWDIPSDKFGHGAMACIVIPSVHDAIFSGVLIDEFATWVNSNLPYCFMSVFEQQTAINICWSENPRNDIYSRIHPSGLLYKRGEYVGVNTEGLQHKNLTKYVDAWRI